VTEDAPRREEPVGRLGGCAASLLLLVSLSTLMFGLAAAGLLGRHISPVLLRVPLVAVAAGGLWFWHFRRVIPWIERHTNPDSALLSGFGVHAQGFYRVNAVLFGLAAALAALGAALRQG
jgi:hypothetical protein